MRTNHIENIVENLFYVLPLIHKKLLKVEPSETHPPVALSPVQVAVMGILRDEGPLPISEIGKKLLIAKPQMSAVLNRMVAAGMVERHPSLRDKRVTHVLLTARGQAAAAQIEESLKNNVRKNLSYLSPRELEELSLLLFKLRELGSRL